MTVIPAQAGIPVRLRGRSMGMVLDPACVGVTFAAIR